MDPGANLTLNSSPIDPRPSGPSAAEIWGIGVFAVTVINSCAVIGIVIMPLLGKSSYHYLLTSLIGLGVGSLSGSALFHLLPEAFQLDEHTMDIYIWKCWTAVAGIYLFFIVDKILKIIVKFRQQRKHQRSNRLHIENGGKANVAVVYQTVGKSNKIADSGVSKIEMINNNNDPVAYRMDTIAPGRKDAKESEENRKNGVSPVAWMVIFGDAIHNFVDGLSIGAAFTESLLAGVSVCVAVVCEEFPHEFGDIAILVSSGMKMRQALGYNLLSAATCYFGFGLGVVVGEMSEATVYIFALASGMFLYVALANMVPEMNDTMERAMDISMKNGFIILLLQCAGIAIGLVIMFLLAFYHSRIKL